MSKSKPSKAKKPLTISIHGEGIDIDAKFQHATAGDAVGRLIENFHYLQTRTADVGAAPIDASQPVLELVRELAKTLRPDQVALFSKGLDANQQILVFEILNVVAPTSASQPPPPPDEVVTRNPPASA